MERIEDVNRSELRDLTGEHCDRNISVSSRVEIENTSRTTLCLSSTLYRHVSREGCAAHVRGLLEKYPTFVREKETGLLGALDT